MKSDIAEYKLRLAKGAEISFANIFSTYETGQFDALGELCRAVLTLAEFYEENEGEDVVVRIPRMLPYVRLKFRKSTVLVLSSDGEFFAYAASDILKFVRGESLHGASDNKDTKRQVLHNYVFEKDIDIEWHFQVSWNWICGPNLRAQAGHSDSGGPFVHAIKVNGRRIEATLIESIVLGAAYEFWQANTNGDPVESTKVFLKFDPSEWEFLWGKKIADKLMCDLKIYHGIDASSSEET